MHRSRDAAVIATGLTTSTSFMMLFAISVDDLSSDRVASVAAEVLGGLVTVGALLGMALLARPSPGRYEHKQRSSLQVEDD